MSCVNLVLRSFYNVALAGNIFLLCASSDSMLTAGKSSYRVTFRDL